VLLQNDNGAMTNNPITDDELEQSETDGELFEHYHFVVDKGQQLLRIDKFLNERIQTSRNKIQNAANAESILVNGKSVKPNYKVKPLDDISIVLPYPKRELELIAENIPLDIIYEDDFLVVINKQANMVVHPGYGNYSGTIVNALIYHFQQIENLKQVNTDDESVLRPGLVHRLDKDTTGVMVIAKEEITLMRLAKQFFDRTISRKYIALVWGDVKEDEGTITGHIGRSTRDRKVFQVYKNESTGKHAVTHYKVLERFGYVTLVECKLETGRTHQIRVHFKHIGHTLFGDVHYEGNKILKGTTFTKYKQFVDNCFQLLPRQALHAKSLGFVHPQTNKEVFFNSELPDDMLQVLEKWRRYANANNK
jgi:23S rRNA pseudouridine1911/1915/1917 synthase